MKILWSGTKKGREIVSILIHFALFTSNKWGYVCVFTLNCFNDLKGKGVLEEVLCKFSWPSKILSKRLIRKREGGKLLIGKYLLSAFQGPDPI